MEFAILPEEVVVFSKKHKFDWEGFMFEDIDQDILIAGVGLVIVIVVLLIIVVVASYHHVHKAAFKPKFRRLPDGSLSMEFAGFGGLQTSRTKRFHEQYKIGTVVVHEGKRYKIAQLKEISDPSLIREDVKIVAYLEDF
jgi:hypothetical protein